MTILVTGGAGYIGSHFVRLLRLRGSDVVVVDDLSTGDAARIPGVSIRTLDLAADDAVPALAEVMRSSGVDSVVHFAGRKRVDESIQRPDWYRDQNVGGLANLLEAMAETGVTRLVFSSSAAVYGEAEAAVDEDSATRPVNPYGETKLEGERLVESWSDAGRIGLSLRYFNVAGAGWPDLVDRGGANLVPLTVERVLAGEPPVIYGGDYGTPDGTAVRDYVHVLDVAEAHLAALDGLDRLGAGHTVLNIGTGRGTTVRQVVAAVMAAAGSSIPPVIEPRRDGDAPSVVASVDRIATRLGWRARFGIDEIVESAWVAATRPRPETGRPA